MKSMFKSTFLWYFVGGFALGAVGLVSLQPADATQTLRDRIEAIAAIA